MTSSPFDPQSVRAIGAALAPTDSAGDAADRHARVVWTHLIEPGDAVAGAAVAALGAPAALERVRSEGPAPDGIAPARWREALARWRPRWTTTMVDDAARRAEMVGATLLIPGDDGWPSALDDLGPHAPVGLWVRGVVAALDAATPAVAVVGARAATSYGEHVAIEMSAELATGGVRIVSGGAYGIDGAAHRAALTAGGITVALLAGGVDRPYPVGHTAMLERIGAHGAVVSEVPPGGAPTKWRFLQRNRLIAAISHATVVVEAGWRSGSLNTAGHAAALARPLGAVPGPITSAASAGCHRLLREYGAECITGADDVREMLGIDDGVLAGLEDATRQGAATRTDDATRVLDALSARVWRDAAEIGRRAGMLRDEVGAHLGVLALTGSAERQGDLWRRRAR